jgi:ATP-dependent exoDNAse (exonuclease V) alpha subunit
MRAKHLARASQFGHQERPVLPAALQRQSAIRAELKQIDPMKEAHKALTFARDHLFEHEAVNTETDLLRTALQRAEGRATLEHIEAALNERREQREFILMKNIAGRRAYTTAQVLQLETENIRLMAEGRRSYVPLVNPARIREENLSRLDAAGPGNQRDAAHQILTCRDRIQGLQGAAGTGKTFTLKTIREELENNGWEVRGFWPTAKASKELADSGIKTTTLQKYLIDAEINGKTNQRTVYVLDESSLADSGQVNRFLKSLGPADRLILVGDVRQHESVGQGRAFAQLQEQSMSAAHLSKIIRQKDAPDLKRFVELFYEGRIHEGVDILKKLDCIKEVKNEQQRFEAIAKEFMQERDHTLVISPDNRSRAGINAVIHRHLQEAGRLDKAETTLQVLVNRQDISGAERGWAKRYEAGNVLR